jgi:heme exporter protein D
VDIRNFSPALTKGFVWLAGLMTAAAVAVHIATYGPDELGPSLMNLALALFPIVFLVFGPAVVVIAFARIPVDRIFASLPIYVYVFGGAVLLYVFVDGFLMVQLLPGQPEQDGSNFYMNNGGDLTPITAEAYRMALMHAARLFSGHELIFFAVGALIGYQLDGIRSGRLNLDVVLRDEAMERSPLPYPLSRVVGLRTLLSPEACMARLVTPPPRPAWTLFAASQGLRGQASTTEFRVEMASPQSQLVYAVGRFGRFGGGATSIRLLMTFKRWPLIGLLVSFVLAPVALAIMGAFGFPLPSFWLAAVLVVGVVGNLLFGLDQRRRLLTQIKRATEATEIPPSDPEFALLT